MRGRDLDRLGRKLLEMAATLQKGDAALSRPGTKAIRNRLLSDLRMALLQCRTLAHAEPGFEALEEELWHASQDKLRPLCPPLPGKRVKRAMDMAVTETPAPALTASRGFAFRVIPGGLDGDAA